MTTLPATIESDLQALEAELDTLLHDHPDDFWAQWDERTRAITARAPDEAHVLVGKRLEDMLIARRLGPGDSEA